MTKKRIVVIMGSPRRNGNSATLAEQVVAGAQEAGAEVESFYLQDMQIEACSACDECQGEDPKECNIEDDMAQIYPKIRKADGIVIASPIYWANVSAQTKLFMDRCYALQTPQGHEFKGKRIGIVLTYGDSNAFNSGAVNALRAFQDAFAYVGAEIAGMVYGSASEPGEIRQNQALMVEARELGKALAA